eukprot:364133-Chlamydomonas_euryale.AAC.14
MEAKNIAWMQTETQACPYVLMPGNPGIPFLHPPARVQPVLKHLHSRGRDIGTVSRSSRVDGHSRHGMLSPSCRGVGVGGGSMHSMSCMMSPSFNATLPGAKWVVWGAAHAGCLAGRRVVLDGAGLGDVAALCEGDCC